MWEIVKKYLPIVDDIRTYNFNKFKSDLISGLTVCIIALPQSMAYAIIAGVHPKYGLYAAIFPAMIAAFFGNSRFLAAGPTNAISMLLSSSLASVFIAGTAVSNMSEIDKMSIVFLISFMVGALQLAMGLLKFGNLLRFISHSVVVGFTSGAAVLIAFNQLKNLLGVNIGDHTEFVEVMSHTIVALPNTNIQALLVGVFTIAFIIIMKRVNKKVPGPLLSLALTAVAVAYFDLDVKTIGSIPQSLPPFSHFNISLEKFRILFMPALAIAILGIVESLSIAKSLASKVGDKVNGDQEFIAQGLANMSASFLSSIPGSGSFTRSAVNFSSGAKSRFSIIMSGLFIMLVLIVAAPMAKYIPIASLAGILMVISYGMIDFKSIKLAIKTTPADKYVIIATIIATLLLELDKAVYVGVFLSIILFVKSVSSPDVYKVIPEVPSGRLFPFKEGKSDCQQLSIYQVEGSLFFGAIDDLEEKLYSYDLHSDNCVVVRLKNVRMVDATAVHALSAFLDKCKSSRTHVIFTNVKPTVMDAFIKSGIMEKIGKDGIAVNTTVAVETFFAKHCHSDICKNCQAKLWKECPVLNV